ncbi:MAG TPA: class I SAM-dependent methyltransferase [Thermoleophilaceae bacterium]|nr:class I SAM-dependent methyltransferase [Thermoleophilaceae bacterium]
MAASSARKSHALELFSGLPRHYDRIAALFSFGQDPRWRRAMVAAVRAGPDERVLDVACGTGLVSRALVRRYGCRVVGLDQSEQMLDRARALTADTPGVELVQGEAEKLPFADGAFDSLTFTYLLRYVDDPGATMRELARVVRPGGRVAMLEFFVPAGPVLYPAWWLYTRAGLPLLGALVSRDWYEVGRFLGPSIDGFWRRHPLDEVVNMWGAAGIGSVEVRKMSLGGGVVMWGVRDDGRA